MPSSFIPFWKQVPTSGTHFPRSRNEIPPGEFPPIENPPIFGGGFVGYGLKSIGRSEGILLKLPGRKNNPTNYQ